MRESAVPKTPRNPLRCLTGYTKKRLVARMRPQAGMQESAVPKTAPQSATLLAGSLPAPCGASATTGSPHEPGRGLNIERKLSE